MSSRQSSRSAVVAIVVAVLSLLLGGLVSPVSAATTTARLKGVVSVDGKPIAFAKVQIFERGYLHNDEDLEIAATRLKTDNTDSRGRYSFSRIPAAKNDNYVVIVTDRTGRTVKTFRYISVKKGRTTTKNVHMKRGVILRGTVNTSDGRSPAGLTVGVDPGQYNGEGPSYEKLYPDWDAAVKADGSFKLSGIPASSYDEVIVADGPYAQQCYDFVARTLADCDSVAFERRRIQPSVGEQRTLPTVTASTFAPSVTKLSGKVTEASGKPLKGIGVRIESAGGARVAAVTRSSGRFSVSASIPAGPYTVRYDDEPGRVWASQFFGGGPDKSVRRPVTVTPGHPVAGLNTVLKSNASTSTDIAGSAGTARFTIRIKRKATGSAPSGRLTLSSEGVSKTVTLKKGRAAITLSGLSRGSRRLVATYSGTSSTAGFTKIYSVKVK